MAERVIEIVIKGKNLTEKDFAAARRELLGLEKQAGVTNTSTRSLAQSFLGAGGAASTFRAQVATMASAFTLGSLLEKGVTELGSFAREALASAGNLMDLRNATGASLGRLQEWVHVADQGGIQLENLTKASFDLGAKLAGGEGLRGAVERLGLSWTTLRNLKPEDQLDQVLRAAEKLGPSQERNAILVEMFGAKGAIALARIVDGYAETAAAASKAGDAQIEALDRAGDAWTKFKRDVATGFVEVMGNTVKGFTEEMAAVDSLTKAQLQQYYALRKGGGDATQFLIDIALERRKAETAANQPVERAAAIQRDYIAELANTKKEIEGLAPEVRNQILAAKELGEKEEDLTQRFGLSGAALKLLTAAERDNAKAKKDLKAGAEDLDPVIERLTASYRKQIEANERLARTISAPAVLDGWRLQRAELVLGAPLISRHIVATVEAVEAARAWAFQNGAVLAPSITRVSAAAAGGADDVRTMAQEMRDALKTVPDTLARAFEGGGDWLGAAKSMGSQFGSILGKNIGSSFAALGAMGGPIGSAIGSLAGPLIGKIGSLFTSKNTAEVRAYNVEIGKVRESLIAAFGPLDDLEAKANAVGLSFRENWGHQGKSGLEAMNNLAAEFKRRWDDLNTSLATSQQELDGVLQRGRDLGYEFDQSGKLVSVSTEKMREVAQKYGVDLKALGPAFDQADLRTRVGDVINAFELLDRGGASTGTILVGLKDEISAIVSDSIKFGTEIPANMEPWIANLIETGQLTDENGEKITDLTKMKFGAPVATEFEKITQQIGTLIDKIAEMVDRINSTLTPAIDNATRDRTVNVGFHLADFPELDIPGMSVGVRGFSSGTHGGFPDFGRGSLAILHNREAVTPFEERVPTAMGWLKDVGVGRSDSGPIVVNTYVVNDFTGSRQVTEAEFRQIQDRINGGGITVPQRVITQRGR